MKTIKAIGFYSIKILLLVFITSCDETAIQFTPPTVITFEATEITGNSATLGGNVTNDGGLQVTSKGIVWGTTENPTVTNNSGIIVSGTGLGEFTSNVTGLAAGTTYLVRAFATNDLETAYGQQISLTTLSTTITYGNGVTDVEGNNYQTIIIGSQEWMTENLKVTHYTNNDPIATGLSNNDWKNTTEGAFAVYPNNGLHGLETSEDVLNAYGALYNWFAVADSRGLCPTGWHIPSDDEWTQLTEYLFNSFNGVSESNIGNQLKSCRQANSPLGEACSTAEHPRWNSHETNYGTDNFGFRALPSGVRNISGSHSFIGLRGFWWTKTEYYTANAWNRTIYFHQGAVDRKSSQKNEGLSARCVKN